MATVHRAPGQAAVPQLQPSGLHHSPQLTTAVVLQDDIMRKPDWTDALITVLRQFLFSFKVIDTLVQ